MRKAGEALAQTPFQQLERLGGATPVEVDRRARPAARAQKRGHQVGSVDTRGPSVPERVQRPHQRLAVGHRQRRAEHGRARLGVLLGGHHEVDGRRRHVSRAPAAIIASIQSITCS